MVCCVYYTTGMNQEKDGIAMKRKNTDDMQSELMSAPDLGRFLSENKENFTNVQFAELLRALFDKKGISKAVLARNAQMSEVYLYQILSGGRNPSRDRIICLCYGMGATLEETQELLRGGGHAELYVKDKRDAVIIFGLTHDMSLAEVNDRLFTEKEKTLC